MWTVCTEWSSMEHTAEEVLAERLAGFQERYRDVPIRRVVVWNQPARHIVEKSESAQLVVISSHGRGGSPECCSDGSAQLWYTQPRYW